MMIRMAAQKATFIKIGTMISRGKSGIEVSAFSGDKIL